MEFAVMDERGEASGETLPKVGFAPWLVDPVTSPLPFWGARFEAPASGGTLADVVMTGGAVDADVLGEFAEMVGRAWFNLATYSRSFPNVIFLEILTCGGAGLAERGVAATAWGAAILLAAEPNPLFGVDDKETAVVVAFVEVGAGAVPDGPDAGAVLPNMPKPPVPNADAGA